MYKSCNIIYKFMNFYHLCDEMGVIKRKLSQMKVYRIFLPLGLISLQTTASICMFTNKYIKFPVSMENTSFLQYFFLRRSVLGKNMFCNRKYITKIIDTLFLLQKMVQNLKSIQQSKEDIKTQNKSIIYKNRWSLLIINEFLQSYLTNFLMFMLQTAGIIYLKNKKYNCRTYFFNFAFI